MCILSCENKNASLHPSVLCFAFCVMSTVSVTCEPSVHVASSCVNEVFMPWFKHCCYCVLVGVCSQAGIAGAPARAVSAVKNMNLPEMPKNINIGDISIKVPNLPSFK